MASQIWRALTGWIGICMFAMLLTTQAFAQEMETYSVYVHQELLEFEVGPVVDDNAILVEFRTVAEKLGYQVGWDADTRTAYGYMDDLHVEFPIGQAEAVVNGQSRQLPLHTNVINGRTLIPLGFLSEVSGYTFTQDSNAGIAYLTTPPASDGQITLASNITLSGFVELSGTVDDAVRYVRVDTAHADSPDESEHTVLEPMDTVLDALIQLQNGPGIYTMKVFTTTGDDPYSGYRLAGSFKIVYPEDPDLVVMPDDTDPNRYTVIANLTEGSEDPLLQVHKLDREGAYLNVSLDVEGEQQRIEEIVYLPFGPGVYQVSLHELLAGEQLSKTTTLTHSGYLGIELEAASTSDSKVRVKGNVSPSMKWMWIQYANPSQSLNRNAFLEIENGRVDQDLHLNMGQGVYEIKLGFAEGTPTYMHYETFVVENNDTRNRHLLPSEAVESEADAILALAAEITEGLESDVDMSAAIYDWMTNHIAPDEQAWFAGDGDVLESTATEVLHDRSGTGLGVARLNAALHRAAGIPVKIVVGELRLGDAWHAHAWNEVYAGDRWIVQDAVLGAGRIDPEARTFTAKPSRDYYDTDARTFAATHQKHTETTE